MRKTFSLSAAILAMAAAAGAAHAEVEFSGNVALTTDYHWRGMTQTDRDMAIQGGFDLSTDSGFYAGTWASNVDFNNSSDTNIEWDLYAGYGFEAAGLGFDVGVIQYLYPDSDSDDPDFLEIYGGVSKEFETFGLGGYVYYDPDNETVYGTAGASFSATDALSFDVNVGQYLDGGDDFYSEDVDYNFGGTYSVGGFDLDLRYYERDDGSDDNVVFTIGRAL